MAVFYGGDQVEEFISESEIGGLPEEPYARFAKFASIARRNFLEQVDLTSDHDNNVLMKMEFMGLISAIATELGIKHFQWTECGLNDFIPFMADLSGSIARIQVRAPKSHGSDTVRLSARTRARIEAEITKLEDSINRDTDLSETKRRALLDKLAEMTAELYRSERLAMGKFLSALAVVGTIIVGATTVAADAPDAVANILALIGKDKVDEDKETARLGAPPKLLPPPKSGVGLDDDIPF